LDDPGLRVMDALLNALEERGHRVEVREVWSGRFREREECLGREGLRMPTLAALSPFCPQSCKFRQAITASHHGTGQIKTPMRLLSTAPVMAKLILLAREARAW